MLYEVITLSAGAEMLAQAVGIFHAVYKVVGLCGINVAVEQAVAA